MQHLKRYTSFRIYTREKKYCEFYFSFMANKVICPKLFRDLRRFARSLNTSPTVPPMNFTGNYDAMNVTSRTLHPTDQILVGPEKKVINFDDVQELFTGVSTSKLIKSSLTLQMASIEPVVDLGVWVMSSKFMHMPIFREVILGFVKRTFYEHFCAGKDLSEICRTVSKLSSVGLKGMLDYGVEHATDNESCDQSMKVFLQTAESTKSLPSSSVRSNSYNFLLFFLVLFISRFTRNNSTRKF